MASPCEFVMANKHPRKANYGESEIRVLLDEVMLAREVLFGSFNNKITIQHKNLAWDTVTAAVNACGVARRSRIEIKEKWKTLKSDAIGRQRRTVKTGVGPPEPVLTYEDKVMQIICCDSNLIQGVTAPCPASFVNPSAATEASEMGASHTLYPDTPDDDIPYTPSITETHMSTAFSMGEARPPMSSSTPRARSSLNDSTLSIPFSVPVDVSSPVVVAQLHDCNITVSADSSDRQYHQDDTWRRSGFRRSHRGMEGRSRKRTPGPECSSDSEERAAFITFLKSSSDQSNAKTALLQAQYENELVNRTRLKTHTLLMEAQHRREMLEIEKLEKELGKSH